VATRLFKAAGAPSAQALAIKKMLYELWFGETESAIET
jgi:hypothetical protein